MSYLGLFLSAFLAATLLPAQSEAVLVALLLKGDSALWLFVAATAGNVLGSLLNWYLGRRLSLYGEQRWFPLKADKLERARTWYQRYGRWSLLLSWVPIIGDPLTLAAGVMREPLRVFLPLVFIAKAGRYLVLILTTLHLAGP